MVILLGDNGNRGGIYLIRNAVTGRVYVGKTHRFRTRARSHERDLRRHLHNNFRLQHDANHHGLGSLVFEPVAIIEDEETRAAVEHAVIISLGDDAYNISASRPRTRLRREFVATRVATQKSSASAGRVALVKLLQTVRTRVVAATCNVADREVRCWANGRSRPRPEHRVKLERFGLLREAW